MARSAADLASVSGDSTHLVVEGAGHIAMATEPEPIHQLIQAIHDMIDGIDSLNRSAAT